MSSERRRWNLLEDGWSWKEAASSVADPEFQRRCEIVVSWLQERLDRTDGSQFIAADAAAAIIRKQRVFEIRGCKRSPRSLLCERKGQGGG